MRTDEQGRSGAANMVEANKRHMPKEQGEALSLGTLYPTMQRACLRVCLHGDWIDNICICFFPPVLLRIKCMPCTLYTNWLLMSCIAWPSKECGAAIVSLLAQYQVCAWECLSANVLEVHLPQKIANWTKVPSYFITCLKYRAAS